MRRWVDEREPRAGSEQSVDQLFALPLDEFVAARNAAAKQATAAGDSVGAARLRALTKPTVAAWVVNQVARSHAQQIDDLVALGDKLRAATEARTATGSPSSTASAGDRSRRWSRRCRRRASTGGPCPARRCAGWARRSPPRSWTEMPGRSCGPGGSRRRCSTSGSGSWTRPARPPTWCR
ncbi:hypothetical protein NKG05_10745 [Oerskovia sp. M15]